MRRGDRCIVLPVCEIVMPDAISQHWCGRSIPFAWLAAHLQSINNQHGPITLLLLSFRLYCLRYVVKGCPRENVAVLGRRRSGNMGSAPANHNPFFRAELFLKLRKGANIEERLVCHIYSLMLVE